MLSLEFSAADSLVKIGLSGERRLSGVHKDEAGLGYFDLPSFASRILL